MSIIKGFSKISKSEKIGLILKSIEAEKSCSLIETEYKDSQLQKQFEGLSENTIANFHLPFGVAPNFLINNHSYTVPMVTEESSVVAAAAKGAKFWSEHGGFQAKVISETKVGHVYFSFDLDFKIIEAIFNNAKMDLLNSTTHITKNMDVRGGGILSLELLKVESLNDTYKIELKVNTCDAMGANFINSILENLAGNFTRKVRQAHFENHFKVIFSILSNYTPACIVESSVSLNIKTIEEIDGMSGRDFFHKFKKAVDIACFDRDRAVTHNKGIMNGIDALVLATGNDFRAVEASAHAYAARDGRYQSLSRAEIVNDNFKFSITLPLALGTVGGLTKLHPLSALSLDILKKPKANELMQIAASVGLAQNFSAIRSLITTGIQKGHMKMHLLNILNQLNASDEQIELAKQHFSDKAISFSAVRDFLAV